MPKDWYGNFVELSACEREGTDFLVTVKERDSGVLVMAPHGGHIEPGTSKIASFIAGSDFSSYHFEGLLRGRKHCELHITSHQFDEPKALCVVAKSSVVLAVHGRADTQNGETDKETVWVGGLDERLGSVIVGKLIDGGFKAAFADSELAGRHPSNICNRGKKSQGVQLELPRDLRNRLSDDDKHIAKFADLVRAAICQSCA